ncbi:tyrosine-type recombinase/integrase [Streptomyces sp. CC77]|uniref:tyrosine-type recombinase/integrase n=1 Tax=Streptomyces sp. CC77 TaxID=1906739 RepID=UPI0008DD72DF|nr:tyrosine-type recombinase/integrase [Streptomyces sp. CC77]OII67461.1 site-specific integrase [Streptomyces sp. CC77]
MLTFDVRIYAIEIRQGRPKPYRVRWRVGTKKHSESYTVKAQADGRRSQLLEARRKGEQFDTDEGLPTSELRERNSVTWFEHAVDYAQMKWPHASAKHRASIAETLATVTPVWTTATCRQPKKTLRLALYAWAFRMVRNPDPNAEDKFLPRMKTEDPPPDIAAALAWIAKSSLPLTDVARPEHVRKGLAAVSTKLNGQKAAENTTRRKRTVLSNAFRYALERDRLDADPLKRVDWAPPATDDEVDFRFVPNTEQVRRLLEGVRRQGDRGEHLVAFFGCLYYAAMRPGEIAALRSTDCVLPTTDGGWGELLLAENRPEVGSGWTDDGTPYDKRGLKRRARKSTRPVPIPPVLVHLLQEHRKRYGTAPDGRLFRAAQGGRVRSTEYCEVWKQAREAALSPEEAASPLAQRPYALRHAGVSLWIQAGVDPPEVARRAGHSLTVLYRIYAKVLRGRETHANELISAALQEPKALPEDSTLQSPR